MGCCYLFAATEKTGRVRLHKPRHKASLDLPNNRWIDLSNAFLPCRYPIAQPGQQQVPTHTENPQAVKSAKGETENHPSLG